MPTILIILILLAVPLVYVVLVYNSFASMKVRIQEAWSQIDVQLKRRTDLIPNLLETVTKARAALMGAQTPEQAGQADNMLTGALKTLFAVAEAYPELKAQEGFVKLQSELSDTEDKVAYSRQFYNSTVRDYNSKLVVFPSNLIGNMFGFKSQEFFEAEEAERAAVKVDF